MSVTDGGMYCLTYVSPPAVHSNRPMPRGAELGVLERGEVPAAVGVGKPAGVGRRPVPSPPHRLEVAGYPELQVLAELVLLVESRLAPKVGEAVGVPVVYHSGSIALTI